MHRSIYSILYRILAVLFLFIIGQNCSDKSSGPEEIPAAKIASTSPERGPVQTRVEIRGENFGEDVGSILFDERAPYVPYWSDSLIKADVPKQINTPCYVHISSKGSDEKDSIYFIVEAMQIESILPDHGLPGHEVTINGSGFGPNQGTVLFDSLEAEIVSWSSNQIKAIVPENAISCNIEVQSQGKVSNLHGFAIDRMTITRIIPNRAIPGTEVEIHGYKFGDLPGSVRFQDAEGEIISWFDTLIITEVPYNANSGNLMVEVSGATSNALSFQVEQLHIREIIPDSATYDEQIEIYGSFYGAEEIEILFGDMEIVPDEFNDTLILTTVPPGADSSDIIVTANDLESNSVFFKLLHMTITSVEPDSGIVGQKIAIHGRYFGSTPGSVYFGDVEAEIDSWTDTLIYIKVPANTESGNICVGNDYESSNAVFFRITNSSNIVEMIGLCNQIDVIIEGYHCMSYDNDTVCSGAPLGLSYIGDSDFAWDNLECNIYDTIIDEVFYTTDYFDIQIEISESGEMLNSIVFYFKKRMYWPDMSSWDKDVILGLENVSLVSGVLETGIEFSNYGVEAVERITEIYLYSVSCDLSYHDPQGCEPSSYINSDWENDEYPPEIRVVFKQR
ncbi:MAG: hypothetical protein GF310_07445 [candidate division Zixibacteria bacterium]|nr:hypothetical protein [candidate division Zixibacteria bacterium]